MTAARARLTHLADRLALTEQQAVSVVATVGCFLAASIAALAWGGKAVDVVLVGAVLWLLWERVGIADLAQQAADDADLTGRKVDALAEEITGDAEPTGRHARPRPTPYRREAA